jgi:hypothetical protein
MPISNGNGDADADGAPPRKHKKQKNERKIVLRNQKSLVDARSKRHPQTCRQREMMDRLKKIPDWSLIHPTR